MWWAGRATLDVYVGVRRVAVAGPQHKWLPPPVPDLVLGLKLLTDWLQQRPRPERVRVWLGGALCRPFLVPVMPVLPRDQAHAALQAVAAERTGLSRDCQVWCEAAASDPGGTVGAALDRAVFDGVMAALAAGRSQCLSLRPWWCEALSHALRAEPGATAVAVLDCSALTFLSGAEGTFTQVATASPMLDPAAAQSALRRYLSGAGVAGERCQQRRLVFDDVVEAGLTGIALDVLAREGL